MAFRRQRTINRFLDRATGDAARRLGRKRKDFLSSRGSLLHELLLGTRISVRVSIVSGSHSRSWLSAESHGAHDLQPHAAMPVTAPAMACPSEACTAGLTFPSVSLTRNPS